MAALAQRQSALAQAIAHLLTLDAVDTGVLPRSLREATQLGVCTAM